MPHSDKTIVQCIPSIADEASGPSYSVFRLCEALLRAGCKTELVGLDTGTPKELPPFVRLFPPGFGPRRLGRSPQMLKWLQDRAGSGKVALLHNHSLWMMPNVYPGRAAASAKIPFVVSPRGTLSPWAFTSGSYAKRAFWPIVQRPAIWKASCFHATSEQEFCDIRDRGFSQPVAIIPNGIDLPDESALVGERRKRVLYLGRIHPIKGLDLLLHAWERVERESLFADWTLRVVGPGTTSHVAEVHGLAKSLGLRQVEFAGPSYGRDKIREYSSASVFVLPSRSENFGVAVAEALACGTPAIVSNSAPWSGLEVNGAGWWVDTSEAGVYEALVAAMGTNANRLSILGGHGRDWMKRDFSWERIGQMMHRTYEWVLGRGTAPAWVRS